MTLALARKPVGEAGRNRTHPCDRHDPEANAGDEHIEAAQAAAQLAASDAKGEDKVGTRRTNGRLRRR